MDDKKRDEINRLIDADNQFHADLHNAAHGLASGDATARAERIAAIERGGDTMKRLDEMTREERLAYFDRELEGPPVAHSGAVFGEGDVRWLVAEVRRLDYERELASDEAASCLIRIQALNEQRARVLDALRAGQYVAALRAAEGE